MNDESPGLDSNVEIVALHAEQIDIKRLTRVTGEIRVSVETRTREHLVDEPLTKVRAHIEQVTIDRFVDEMPSVREEGETTVIPVVEEVLVRRLLLKEEVRITRVAVSEPHQETVTLRYQDVVVSRTPREDVPAPAVEIAQPTQ